MATSNPLGKGHGHSELEERDTSPYALTAEELRGLWRHQRLHGHRTRHALTKFFKRNGRKKDLNEVTRLDEEEEAELPSPPRANAAVDSTDRLITYPKFEMDLIIPTHHMAQQGGDALVELKNERELELARAAFINFDRPGDTSTYSSPAGIQKEVERLKSSYAYEYVIAAKVTKDLDWLRSHETYAIDTGSTHHVTNLLKNLTDPRSTRMTITGVSGGPQLVDCVGKIIGHALDDHGGQVKLTLDDAIGYSKAHMNLLSASKMLQQGTVLHLEKGNCYMIVRGESENGMPTESTIPLIEHDGLFYLQLKHLVPEHEIRAHLAVASLGLDGENGHGDDQNAKANVANYADLNLWHRRLGHMNKDTIRLMFNQKVFEGLDIKDLGRGCDAACTCPTCAATRANRQPIHKTARYDPKLIGVPFRNVQTDIKGPLVRAFGRYRYSISFICSESRYGKTYFLEKKSHAYLALKTFLKDVDAMGYASPVNILSDFGTEFSNSAANKQAGESAKISNFDKICLKNKIDHQVTPPNTSRINGKVERYHRTLHEAANAFLYDARLSPIFWPYAVAHAEYVKNRVVHRALSQNVTPHEIVTRMRPRADRIRVFGSDMYEYNSGMTKSMPGRPKATKLIYLGIPRDSSRGYLGFDPETRRIKICYDVTFDENMANRADNLRIHDAARNEFTAQEELAFNDQKSTIESDQVRQVYAHDRCDDDKGGKKHTDKNRNFSDPLNLPSNGGSTPKGKRLKLNKKSVRHWISSLPSIARTANDDHVGTFVHIPFDNGYYYGVVTGKSNDDPPEGAPAGYIGYDVTFEDGDEVEFDKTIIKDHTVEDDHSRRKGKPSKQEIARAHRDYGKVKKQSSKSSSDRKKHGIVQARRNPRRSATKEQSHLLNSSAMVSRHHPSITNGPLTKSAVEEYYRRELLELHDGQIRPHRLEAVGHRVPRTNADNSFIKKAMQQNIPILFMQPNPKKEGSESHDRYGLYCLCTTLNEVISICVAQRKKGISEDDARKKAIADIYWDYEHAYIMFPQNESLLDGHIFNAKQLAQDNKYSCRADLLMQTAKAPSMTAMHAILGTKGGDSFHDQLMEEKRRNDTLKFCENPTALNSLMSHELKKLPIFDQDGEAHFEPANTKEAHGGKDEEHWRRSEKVEMDALEKFGTFQVTYDLPKFDNEGNRIRLMGGRFVYKLKTRDDGTLKKFKSRFVVRGFSSREGIEHDADEVYAPVMSYDSMRSIIAIAAGNGWIVRQTDVSNAYLNADLVDKDGNERPIYMEDPLGRKCAKTGRPAYLKLRKSLYGLKQAGALWCKLLHKHLLEHKFERSPSDSCVFTTTISRSKVMEYMEAHEAGGDLPDVTSDPNDHLNPDDQMTLIVGTYVDDMIFTGSDSLALDWFDLMLAKRFEINPTDTGEAHHALGARIRQDRDLGIITMDQTAAIVRLAETYGLDKTNPSSLNATPASLEPLPKISKTEVDFPYLSAVGSLLHIAGLTRPDISWAVGAAARHGAAYGKRHVRAVKRIIAYLYHTRNHGIVYRNKQSVEDYQPLRRLREAVMFEAGRPPPMTAEGEARLLQDPYQIYCDADFAGDTTRRSTMGAVTFLNCAPISWTSRLMKLQALSTTESEIYACTEAIKDAAYMKTHLAALKVRDYSPIPVHEDNSACITMGISYLKNYSNARHYVTRLNFLQERVYDQTVQLIPTPTKEQIADVLTKSLSYEDFRRFRDVLVHDVLAVANGANEQAKINILSVLEGEEYHRKPMNRDFFNE